MNPIRVSYNQACELLAIKRDALNNRVKKDPTFPRPYKCGETRQAAVYFDYSDLVAWHNSQKTKAAGG